MASSISQNVPKTWGEMDRDEKTHALEMIAWDYGSQVQHFPFTSKVEHFYPHDSDCDFLLRLCHNKRCINFFAETQDQEAYQQVYLLLEDGVILMVYKKLNNLGFGAKEISLRRLAENKTKVMFFLGILQHLAAKHVARKKEHLASAEKLRDSIDSARKALNI